VSIEWISLLLLVSFCVLLLLGLPLAWVTGAVGTLFAITLFDINTTFMLVSRIYRMTMNYTLVAVPLFVFMAAILQRCGLAEQLFRAVYVWAGGLRGGLAIGTIISCTIMAAIVGIVGAEIVTFGMVALPAMLARNYDKRLALGSICAGGGMATLIPPSVVFIVYAMTAGAPVGELFFAGIVPGLILAALFIGYILVATWIKPEMAAIAAMEERTMPLRQKLSLLKGLIMPGILALVVLGSIYAGVATPTEAAGVGCMGALLTAAINRRLTREIFKLSLYETTRVSCIILWLAFGAQTIIGVYNLAGGDEFVRNAVMALPFGKWGTIIYMQVILIVLGMFLDWIGILMLTMPLFVPIVLEMGFSNVWFGVVFCMNMHISYLSPPFGPSIFYLKGVVSDDISMGDIYRSVWPYTVLTFVALTLTVIFPGLSLWLPTQMMGR
jgi:tripartite ATP-independent transporter DctM subunit